MYTAVLAVSNTPPRSPLTWAKSVSGGPVIWIGLDTAYQSPAGLNTVAIRAFRHDLATFQVKGGRGVIPGLPSIRGKNMRWVVRSDQAKYMRERQKQNKSKTVQAEVWAKQKLKTTGHKWNRQTIWGCRLFDFWCHKLGIAVEIDGMTHNKVYDAIRDEYNFYRSGIIVLRVPNYDELAMQKALETIAKADSWEVRKVKMRDEFGLQEGQNFRDILKIVGIEKAHGNWSPQT